MSLLELQDLETGYTKKKVVSSLSLRVQARKITALIGPNGAGKSTVLRAIMGLLPVWDGDIIYQGESIVNMGTAERVSHGLAMTPQGHRVFDQLTVRENLEVAGLGLSSGELMDRFTEVFELLPAMKDNLDKRAAFLSGGEQQMLSIGRAMIPRPQLLLMDEPSLGLSGKLVDSLFETINRINYDSNVTILLVEQKVRRALQISDDVCSLKLGKKAYSGAADDLASDKERLESLFL